MRLIKDKMKITIIAVFSFIQLSVPDEIYRDDVLPYMRLTLGQEFTKILGAIQQLRES